VDSIQYFSFPQKGDGTFVAFYQAKEQKQRGKHCIGENWSLHRCETCTIV